MLPLLSVACDIHHIFHPCELRDSNEVPKLWERIAGVFFLVLFTPVLIAPLYFYWGAKKVRVITEIADDSTESNAHKIFQSTVNDNGNATIRTTPDTDLRENRSENLVDPVSNLIERCIDRESGQKVTTAKVYQVISEFFENDLIIAPSLWKSTDKFERRKEKRLAKEKMNDLIDQNFFQENSSVKVLKEFVNSPRVAEARYAMSIGIAPERFTESSNLTWKLLDRKGNPLLIFKEMEEDQIQNEINVYEFSRRWGINVKETGSATIRIEDKNVKGMTQNFIKNALPLQEISAFMQNIHENESFLEQFQKLFLFDLLHLNDDRHLANFLIREDPEPVLFAIDNERINRGFPWEDNPLKGLQNFYQLSKQSFLPEVKEFIRELVIEDFIIQGIHPLSFSNNMEIDTQGIVDCLKRMIEDDIDLSPLEFSWFLRCVVACEFEGINNLSDLIQKISVKELIQILALHSNPNDNLSGLDEIQSLQEGFNCIFPDLQNEIEGNFSPKDFLQKFALVNTSSSSGWNVVWRVLFVELLITRLEDLKEMNLREKLSDENLEYLKKIIEKTKSKIEDSKQNFCSELLRVIA